MKSGMIGCEIFLTQTLRLTQDDIFFETKVREHTKNTLISSQYIYTYMPTICMQHACRVFLVVHPSNRESSITPGISGG